MAGCKRVLIWSGWLRLGHAGIGLSVPLLLLSGWLIAESPSLYALALDLHYLGAAILLFGLIVRAAVLLRGKEHERLAALVPTRAELAAIAGTLRCYISMGRLPLPAWYAHNPLWKPLYLLIYLALALLAATGAAMQDTPVIYGFYLPSVHLFWAQVTLWLTVLHIGAVILHEYKNQTADISAMVNGHRVFLVDTAGSGTGSSDARQYVSLDSISQKG